MVGIVERSIVVTRNIDPARDRPRMVGTDRTGAQMLRLRGEAPVSLIDPESQTGVAGLGDDV